MGKWLARIAASVIAGVLVWQITKPWSISSTEPLDVPKTASLVSQDKVSLRADVYWAPSGVAVKKGDWITIAAEGQWWSGINNTDPAGDNGVFGFFRPACGACPVPGARLGELVGRIGNGPPFRIGMHSTRVCEREGGLRFAMNDNIGPCKLKGEGSCYDDNNGDITINVSLYRIK